MKNIKYYLSAALWILIYLGVASVIGNVTREQIPDWYALLRKPPLNPPDFVFPIVWTILYVMIAIAGWRLCRASSDKKIIILFAVQTLMNWAWSFFFFKYHLLGFSFAWILALIGIVCWLIVSIRKSDRVSALLLIPYLLWISFAAYLNGMIWHLN